MPKYHPETDVPSLDWRGDVPVARNFDDPYFSLNGGLDETRHVFLDGNGLPRRFSEGFHIAELGFGTGLNALTALMAWHESGTKGRLRFTSFEQFLMAPDDMARAISVYPQLAAISEPVLDALTKGRTTLQTDDLHLEIITGDARETLPDWQGKADAWFLDGFSPAKNPELWEPALLIEVARHTKPQGTAATYSAAGHVRASLADAGFTVERRPGFGTKRHMTAAWLA